MKLKNCLISLISSGCLILIIIVIATIYLINGTFKKSDELINKPLTHLEKSNKEVKYKIGLISDTENDWESFKSALQIVNDNNVEIIVHLGDISHLGVSEDLEEAKIILDDTNIKYYAVPGDRDLWKSDGLENFNDTFGKSYSIIEIEEDKILLIDNSDEYRGIDDSQNKFIESHLKDTKFVMLHNPIAKSTSIFNFKMMGQYSEEVNNQRVSLLDKIRKSPVNAVFAGDQHVFNESIDDERDDLFHYIIGSLNIDRSLAPSFAILTVYEDGDYHVERFIVQ